MMNSGCCLGAADRKLGDNWMSKRNMSKPKILVTQIMMGVIILSLLAIVWSIREKSLRPIKMVEVRLNEQVFHLEVALNDAQRRRGLMGRTSVAGNGGMLFVFPDEQVRTFWMRNCLVPLDVVFINDERRITAIHTMAVPKSGGKLVKYSSIAPVRFAIELAGGRAGEIALKAGQTLDIDLRDLKLLVR